MKCQQCNKEKDGLIHCTKCDLAVCEDCIQAKFGYLCYRCVSTAFAKWRQKMTREAKEREAFDERRRHSNNFNYNNSSHTTFSNFTAGGMTWEELSKIMHEMLRRKS